MIANDLTYIQTDKMKGKTMKKEKTKVLFVRIPESWLKKINKIAENEVRTQVSVARQAIKEFLAKR